MNKPACDSAQSKWGSRKAPSPKKAVGNDQVASRASLAGVVRGYVRAVQRIVLISATEGCSQPSDAHPAFRATSTTRATFDSSFHGMGID
jgi:hypothetical protein